MEKLTILIPERMNGQRLDSSLAEMLPNISRSKITSVIKTGNALNNGQKFKPKDKANGNELICLVLKQTHNNHWAAENIPLDIVYEDEDILIINKPFGLVTHPGAGNWNGTLANALIDQLQNHSVVREYSAIVYGNMISGGTVDESIGRDPKDRVKQAIRNNGKEAITHYRVIDRFANHTHVKAILETGRTHQIRVHLSHIGYPLIGDLIYGGRLRFPKKASEELKNALKSFERQALHSKKLTLIHPGTGKSMTWKIELPEDMKQLVDVLNGSDSLTDIN